MWHMSHLGRAFVRCYKTQTLTNALKIWPLLWTWIPTWCDESFEMLIQRVRQFWSPPFLDHFHQLAFISYPIIWIFTCHNLPTSHCKTVGVNLLQWLPRKLIILTRTIKCLRCSPSRSSCLARLLERLRVPFSAFLRASEVSDLHFERLTFCLNHDIGTLEISVCVSLCVNVIHALCNLDYDVKFLTICQGFGYFVHESSKIHVH